MRALLFCVVVALAVACAVAQSRPKLSETFETHGIAQIRRNRTTHFGEVRWVWDHSQGKSLEWAVFAGFDHVGFYDLARWDLKKNYFIRFNEEHKCEERDITMKMPLAWDWVEKASSAGNLTRNGQVYDLWQYTTAGVTLEVGVPQRNANELAYFSRKSSVEEFHFYVEQWRTEKPHASWFEVPKECQK